MDELQWTELVFLYIHWSIKDFNCRPTKVTTSRLQTNPTTSVDSIAVVHRQIFYCRSTYIAVITSAHSLLIHLRKWRLFKLPEQPMGCELYLRFNLSCTKSAKFLHLQKMFWSKSTYSGPPQLLCVFYFTVCEPYEHHTNNCLHRVYDAYISMLHCACL